MKIDSSTQEKGNKNFLMKRLPCNQGSCGTSKSAQGKRIRGGDCDDEYPSKTSTSITNLPVDCLNLIFKCLESKGDRDAFGLTCIQWLHIQNNNHQHLWYLHRNKLLEYPSIGSSESFPILFCKLLIRFQHLKYLSLQSCPVITDFVSPQSQFFGPNVQHLCLDYCRQYSDVELCLIFSWFPRLTDISLKFSCITDKGLEALVKCYSSLKAINLSMCDSITDSGISFLLQNCPDLSSLKIDSCSNITGIGFLGCPKNLTRLVVGGCKLVPEGINAIVSGGGLESLCLATPYNFGKIHVGEGSITTAAIMSISQGCPLLEVLILTNCVEVGLEGWEAIGRNCKNLGLLNVYGCSKLCDQGLQAVCNGCNKLWRLYVDDDNSCSSSALDIFKHNKPGVMDHLHDIYQEVIWSDMESKEKDKIEE